MVRLLPSSRASPLPQGAEQPCLPDRLRRSGWESARRLGAALSRYLLVRTRPWENVLLLLAALLLVAPELYSSLLGLALIVPVLLRHWQARHSDEAQPA